MTYSVRNIDTTISGLLGSNPRTVNVWQVIDDATGEAKWEYLDSEAKARRMADALNTGDAQKIREADEMIRYDRVLTDSERNANCKRY